MKRFNLEKILLLPLFALALGHVALFLFVALSRLGYPYQLDWTEGGVVDHIGRVLAGQPIYVAPSLDFVPFIYTPIYYHVCALAARLTGLGFLPLRLVSLAASLGCMGLIFVFVRRETRSSLPSLLAACFYAASYPLSGFWHDVGRVDSLFMLFLLGGIFFLRGAHAVVPLALAGVLFTLAFFTKQTTLFIVAPLVVWSLLCFPWRLKFVMPVTLAMLVGLATVMLDRASHGWFRYYVFTLPRQHPLDFFYLKQFWIRDLARPLAIAVGMMLLFLARGWRVVPWRDTAFFILLAGGTIGSAWASRLHSLGFSNVLLPAHAGLALTLGLGLGAFAPGLFTRRMEAPPIPNTPGSSREVSLILTLCILQFAMLYYDPIPQIPTLQDREAGDRIVRILRDFSGEVFIPYHSYLVPRAGKRPHAHAMPLLDVLRGADAPVRRKLDRELHAAYAGQRFAAILSDGDWYPEEVERFYEKRETLEYRGATFRTVIGMRTRPDLVYVPTRFSRDQDQ